MNRPHSALLVLTVVTSALLPALSAEAVREYGLRGCEGYRGEDYCISVRAENRAGTVHGVLGPACATNGAARPDVKDGTELSFFIRRAKVRDLAFHLGCLLELEHGVSATREVAELTLTNATWEGVLGAKPAGPIPTLEGRSVWILVESPGSRIQLVGTNRETR